MERKNTAADFSSTAGFFWFSEGGAAERTSISLSDWGAPRAYFSFAGKVGKSAPGRPRSPIFYLIGRLQGKNQLPLNFCEAAGLLVIGAVFHGLRLTALESRAVSFFADESLCSFRRSRQLVAEK